MAGRISDTIANEWLQALAGKAKFAAVHFEVPVWSDPSASEASNPGYSRQSVLWSSDSVREMSNANSLLFAVLPETLVYAIGLWTDLVNGTLVAYTTVTSQEMVHLSSSGALEIPIGEIALRVA